MSLEPIAKCAFWISVLALGYTYLGYPALVWLISRFGEHPIQRGAIEPTVSIIITAYNEERHLREKLKNTLTLDYPAGKTEIIVASDCSNDRTDEIVREFGSRGVRLHHGVDLLDLALTDQVPHCIVRKEDLAAASSLSGIEFNFARAVCSVNMRKFQL